MERVYHIPTLPAGTTADTVDWSAIPAASIDNFFWYEGHTPVTTAKLVYVEDYGFIRYEMGYAAAVSVALLALIYAFSFVARKLFEEKD